MESKSVSSFRRAIHQTTPTVMHHHCDQIFGFREMNADRLRLAMHDRSRQHALQLLLELGLKLWPAYKGVEPEVIADGKQRRGLQELALGDSA